MIIDCPMCGRWWGPSHGDSAVRVVEKCEDCLEAEEQEKKGEAA